MKIKVIKKINVLSLKPFARIEVTSGMLEELFHSDRCYVIAKQLEKLGFDDYNSDNVIDHFRNVELEVVAQVIERVNSKYQEVLEAYKKIE